MLFSPQEQFKQFLEKSKDVLLLLPKNPDGDSLSSALAFSLFLNKINVHSSLVLSDPLPDKYAFLPKPEKILSEISGARDFVLSFDTAHNKIEGFRTEELDGKFNIYLTPEKDSINPRDFSFILAKFKYDLLVVFGSPDLESMGNIYEKNTELFFEVPLVNIDCHSTNSHFGQINLVDITASSCSEILYSFFDFFDPQIIDRAVSDCLLSGLISSTESFQNKKTTPRSLQTASLLMNAGADQQSIVRWLYKTQPLHILKLWGRAMTNLSLDAQTKTVWTKLSVEDFVQSRSSQNDVPTILEKLQENYTEGIVFIAIYNDTPASSIALIKTSSPETLEKLAFIFNEKIEKNFLQIKIPLKDISLSANMLLEKIKKF